MTYCWCVLTCLFREFLQHAFVKACEPHLQWYMYTFLKGATANLFPLRAASREDPQAQKVCQQRAVITYSAALVLDACYQSQRLNAHSGCGWTAGQIAWSNNINPGLTRAVGAPTTFTSTLRALMDSTGAGLRKPHEIKSLISVKCLTRNPKIASR